jgi:hypothetical protein
MSVSRRRGVFPALLVLAACGCTTTPTPAPPPGIAPGCPPQSLLDAEVRMTTRWSASPDETPDVRVIGWNNGQLTCSYEGAGGRREGYVRESDWNALWTRLEPVSPWATTPATVKPQDPTGGPYHLIQMRAGNQLSQFSSQHRADLLVFTSREASDRLQYSNAIVDFVGARAKILVAPAPAPETLPAPAPRLP